MVDYTDVINEISQVLFKAILEREPDLRSKVHQLDRELYKLLRSVGLLFVSMLLGWLSTQVTQEAKATGMTVHRRKQVKYKSLFGEIKIESPYLWNKNTRFGARPVKEQLGTPRMVITLLQWNEPGRILELKNLLGKPSSALKNTTAGQSTAPPCLESVEYTALKAQSYVEQRLLLSRLDYSQPLETRPGYEQVLVELDGCHIRTGTLIPIEKAEVTKKRRLTKRKRESDWREVRVGFARPLEDKEKRTYVAKDCSKRKGSLD